MSEGRCDCGATIVRGALACSLCHAPSPLAVPAVLPAGPDAVAAGPNGFIAAPPRPTLRNDQRVFSRVQSGPMSFGWQGRLVLTVLCAIPIVFVWFMTGGGIVTVLLSLPVFVLPVWFLRESWRRSRVR